MLLARFLAATIRTGTLVVIDANGKKWRFGTGGAPGAAIRLHDRRLHRRLLLNPRLALGEAFVDGTLTIEDGTLRDLLDVGATNLAGIDNHLLQRAGRAVAMAARRLLSYNPIGKAQRNVAHHYDLSDDLYDLFLDDDRQYSCAYFRAPDDSLETAQAQKRHHLAGKLLLDRPGLRVLDIGSGWGGLGLHLARECGARVTGVTLSAEQQKVSQRRAEEAGLAHRVQFHLRDYREEQGTYDRIVSVGMFEHVGTGHYGEFFAKAKHLLADDGVMLLHSIGRMEPPGTTNPWLRKYIFPGGYTPALSETIKAVEKVGLWMTDIEILRLHYAQTLHHWQERFAARRDEAKALYDERFCRMWEFYLVGCEVSFRRLGQMVFQMQLAKHQDAVPLIRDYITDWDRGVIHQAQVQAAAE